MANSNNTTSLRTITMSLGEVRDFYSPYDATAPSSVIETVTCFLVNRFGKYQPNLCFVIPKVFDMGIDGKVIDPLKGDRDEAVTGEMNIDFRSTKSYSPKFIFGDYWVSKKGTRCFRPKRPKEAKHLLIEVDWGGPFGGPRGQTQAYASSVGALYFRRASSNGGGVSKDYWVVPVGFKNRIVDPEIDGDATWEEQVASTPDYIAKYDAEWEYLREAIRFKDEVDRLVPELRGHPIGRGCYINQHLLVITGGNCPTIHIKYNQKGMNQLREMVEKIRSKEVM